MIVHFVACLVLAAPEAPPRPALERGNLRVEFDSYQMGSVEGQTLGQFQGHVQLTLQGETRQLRLQAQTITLGLDLSSATPLQIATARGDVHIEIDLPDPRTQRTQHLVADSEWVIYSGREEKVTVKSPATITLTSSTPEGPENTLQLTPRKEFIFWLRQMPPPRSQEILSELEAAGYSPGEGPEAASEPPAGGS